MSQQLPLIRTSERSLFKRCKFAHDLCYNRGLKQVGTDAPALRFGTLVHQSLEKFYKPGLKRGPRPATTFEKLYYRDLKEAEKSFGMTIEDEWVDAVALGIDMLENYWDVYGKDEEYKVLATEQTFKVPVYSRAKRGKILFYYVGTLDGVWLHRPTKKCVITDHKTAKAIESLIQSLPQDDQAGAYWTFGVDWLYGQGIIPKKQKLHGMMYNILRKGLRDDRPKNAAGQYLNNPTKPDLLTYCDEEGLLDLDSTVARKLKIVDLIELIGPEKAATLGQVSKIQPSALLERYKEWRSEGNRKVYRKRTIDEFREMMAVKSGDLAVTKSPSQMNCNMCGYRGPCELHEAGQDMEPMLASAYTDWDPYDAHSIEEEGK